MVAVGGAERLQTRTVTLPSAKRSVPIRSDRRPTARRRRRGSRRGAPGRGSRHDGVAVRGQGPGQAQAALAAADQEQPHQRSPPASGCSRASRRAIHPAIAWRSSCTRASAVLLGQLGAPRRRRRSLVASSICCTSPISSIAACSGERLGRQSSWAEPLPGQSRAQQHQRRPPPRTRSGAHRTERDASRGLPWAESTRRGTPGFGRVARPRDRRGSAPNRRSIRALVDRRGRGRDRWPTITSRS